MPERVRSFQNPNGTTQATSADEYYQRQRLTNQNQANQNAQLQAQLQDAAANRALQLQTMGSYADRARQAAEMQGAGFAHDTSMEGLRGTNAQALGRLANEGNLATTREGNMPALARLGIEERMYNDRRGDDSATRAYNQAMAERRLEVLNALPHTGAPAPQANMTGQVFQDQGRAFGPQQPTSAGGAAALNPFSSPAPRGGNPQDGNLMDMLDRLNDPEGYGRRVDAREARDYGREQEKRTNIRNVIAGYKEAAKASGNAAAYADLTRDELALDNGAVPDLAKYKSLIQPDLAQTDASSATNAKAFKESGVYQSALADIIKTAEMVSQSKLDPSYLVQKREALVKQFVARKVDPQTALAMVNQDLQAQLPTVLGAVGKNITEFFNPSVEYTAPERPRQALGF